MGRFGYSDRGAFWRFVHDEGLPYIRLNSRVARFDETVVEAWLKRRTIGGAK
jgi:transposase